MSVADEIERLCIAEAVRVQGDADAGTELAIAVASALATVIAITLCGYPSGRAKLTQIVAAEMADMVERRAAGVRECALENAGGLQ